MTIEARRRGWLDREHHAEVREMLIHTCARYQLLCPAYCLMPDHAHFLFMGLSDTSNQRNAVKFFRKAWRGSRPAWGEFSVEIAVEYVGDPPWLDLDNVAKAILDAIKGYAFHDDAQVSRLLGQRASGERERITVSVERL